MNRFELRVREADLHEKRQVVVLMQEGLEVAERRRDLVGRRRDKGGSGERRTARPDPVLAAPELARR